MKGKKTKATESVEEYLEVLCRLFEEGKKMSTTNIASMMKVSPASVSGMLKKLEKDGYVKHSPYKDIELSTKGKRLGRKILGRHRVIESFLDLLGMRKNKIHGEACKLEHYVSDELEDIIKKRLDGHAGKSVVSMVHMKEGEECRVFGIDGGARAARRLEDMGLTPGARVRIMKSAPFSGPVEVCIRDSCLVLGRGVASKVFVKVVK